MTLVMVSFCQLLVIYQPSSNPLDPYVESVLQLTVHLYTVQCIDLNHINEKIIDAVGLESPKHLGFMKQENSNFCLKIFKNIRK